MRGLYYEAFKAATEPELHSVISGTAPAGAKLTLTKSYTLDTSLTTWPSGTARRSARRERDQREHHRAGTGKFEWHVNPSLRPSQYNSTFIHESYTLTCSAADGTVLETTTVKVARGQLVNRSLCTQGGVGGTVPATLALTLGTATFGAFTPGVARDYDAPANANVISTAGDANLSRHRPVEHARPASSSTARSASLSRCRRGRPARPPAPARRWRRSRVGQPDEPSQLDRPGQQRPGDGRVPAVDRRR